MGAQPGAQGRAVFSPGGSVQHARSAGGRRGWGHAQRKKWGGVTVASLAGCSPATDQQVVVETKAGGSPFAAAGRGSECQEAEGHPSPDRRAPPAGNRGEDCNGAPSLPPPLGQGGAWSGFTWSLLGTGSGGSGLEGGAGKPRTLGCRESGRGRQAGPGGGRREHRDRCGQRAVSAGRGSRGGAGGGAVRASGYSVAGTEKG